MQAYKHIQYIWQGIVILHCHLVQGPEVKTPSKLVHAFLSYRDKYTGPWCIRFFNYTGSGPAIDLSLQIFLLQRVEWPDFSFDLDGSELDANMH